jgi:hypothetical protein
MLATSVLYWKFLISAVLPLNASNAERKNTKQPIDFFARVVMMSGAFNARVEAARAASDKVLAESSALSSAVSFT